MVPLVYLIGLVAMIFTALSYAQMSKAFPIAGSVYSYVGRGLNKHLGFLAGWTILLDYLLVPTLLYVFAAESMAGHLPRRPEAGVDRPVPGRQHRRELHRHLVHRDRQPDLPGGRAALHRHLPRHGHRRGEQGRRRRDVHHQAAVRRGDTSRPASPPPPCRSRCCSFLGFDGIATLSEEAKGGRRAAGIAMITGLILVATFFVAQTWLAAMLVPGQDSPSATRRSTTPSSASSQSISNHGWQVAFLAMNALAVGIANAVAAQSATSRLLFSMSRDGRLPRFLSHVNTRTRVPERAILLVGGADPAARAGLRRPDRHDLLAGQLRRPDRASCCCTCRSCPTTASASGRRTSSCTGSSPILGFLIIGYVLWNAEPAAKIGGLIWLAIGVLVLLYYTSRGHRHPARARRPVRRLRPRRLQRRRHAHDRPPAVQGPGQRRVLGARTSRSCGSRRAPASGSPSRPTTSPTPRWSSSATCPRSRRR